MARGVRCFRLYPFLRTTGPGIPVFGRCHILYLVYFSQTFFYVFPKCVVSTSAVSSTDWMIDVQLSNLHDIYVGLVCSTYTKIPWYFLLCVHDTPKYLVLNLWILPTDAAVDTRFRKLYSRAFARVLLSFSWNTSSAVSRQNCEPAALRTYIPCKSAELIFT